VSERRLLSTLAMLAVLAGAVWLGVWWLRPAPGNAFVGPPRSGYTMRNFTAWAYGDTGRLAFRLSSPFLQRREGDESLYLNAPTFLLPPKHGSAGVPWHGQSQYGWVSGDGSVLKLQGAVHMTRPAEGTSLPAEVHTADVTAWVKQNTLATDARASIIQGPSTMTGTGLRADLNTKHLELLHDVHGTFKPSSHRR
jgi:lipopolysaccharide export system protein LptC